MQHWQDAAAARGLDPWHPGKWSPEGRSAMQRWKLARFKARWRHLQAMGHPALVRAQSGRARLIEMVRADLDRALAPFPAEPYTVCPCHPHRLGMGVSREAQRTVQEAVTYLRTFKRASKGALHG
jgi:hypothetical protein